MCGIWAYIELIKGADVRQLYDDFMKIKNRGPDMSSFQDFNNVHVGFHRLAIMDPTFHANQPYIIEDGERTIVFICNGEIYNFKELISNHNLPIKTNADCLTIPHLYLKNTEYRFFQLLQNEIKGEFAFCLFVFDRLKNLSSVVVARDSIGVRPLYYHEPTVNHTENLIFSSEIKACKHYDNTLTEFPPGHLMSISIGNLSTIEKVFYYKFVSVYDTKPIYDSERILKDVRDAVINSVSRRLVADRPIAFLLSGGVDSSLVAGISAKLLGQPIRTFCCGMNDGTDMKYARMVAEHIGSNHTEVYFSEEEGLEAIRDVIYTIESYDVTSIRASVGQYLVCKYIGTKTDARVVMVGEGPDEVCSSYLFNYYAPSGEALDKCAKEYVERIHMYDGRRADRCISRWSLEGRVPLLDPEFISTYWSIPDSWRMPTCSLNQFRLSDKPIEKFWLRKAFDGTNVIPNDVLWRKKEAFSDGVSSKEKSWYQIIQEHIDTIVSDEEFISNKEECVTKEQYYYKKVFIEFFGLNRLNIIPGYWLPKWSSDGNEVKEYMDPSARVLKVYQE